MSELSIPWAPRVVLTGRTFRLPVQAPGRDTSLSTAGFLSMGSRFSQRDGATYHYMKAPEEPGDHTVRAACGGETAKCRIQVRSLPQLRECHDFNGARWPRRWPPGRPCASTKARQTLQDVAGSLTFDRGLVDWWTMD